MNLPSFNCQIAVILNSWKSPEILKATIPIIKKSSKLDTKIYVCLNESDKESVNYLLDEKIDFISLNQNFGTISIDCLLGTFKSEKVLWMNDDMYLSDEWDKSLLELHNEYYPCATQIRGVEKGFRDGIVCIGDPDLPDFLDKNAYNIFSENVKNNKYQCDLIYGLFHPIMVNYIDILKVGGFTGRDIEFFPGHSVDSYAAFKLWRMNHNYKFIISNKTFEYHASSYSNNKLKNTNPEANNRHNSERFNQLAGMTQQDFHRIIKYREKV